MQWADPANRRAPGIADEPGEDFRSLPLHAFTCCATCDAHALELLQKIQQEREDLKFCATTHGDFFLKLLCTLA